MKTTRAQRLTLLAVTLLAAGCQELPFTTATKPQPVKPQAVTPQITESSLRERATEQLAAGVKQYDAGEYDNAVKSLTGFARARHALQGRPVARAQVHRVLALRVGPRAALPRRVPQGFRDQPRFRAHHRRGRPPHLGAGLPQRADAAHHRARGRGQEAAHPAREGRADALRRASSSTTAATTPRPSGSSRAPSRRASGTRRTR